VIWCNIPLRETPDTPGPPHPCIVRDIERNDDLGEAIVHVTRGTSNLKKETREFKDLIVERPGELAVCGLKEPTRFDLTMLKTRFRVIGTMYFSPTQSRWENSMPIVSGE
jgi:hypothetical protein